MVIIPKVNMIAWLEFELTYFESSILTITPRGSEVQKSLLATGTM